MQQVDAGDDSYELLARTCNSAAFRPPPHAIVKDSDYPQLKDIKPTSVKKKVAPAELKDKLRVLKAEVIVWNTNWER
jgi:hypothetical protein